MDGEQIVGAQLYKVIGIADPGVIVAGSFNNLNEIGEVELIAVSNENGLFEFTLPESEEVVQLVVVVQKKVKAVFQQEVTEDTAWRGMLIEMDTAEVEMMQVKGVVKNRWKQPVSGAIICNKEITSEEQHQSNLKDDDYVFTVSTKDGTFIMNIPKDTAQLTLTCLITGPHVLKKTLDIPDGISMVEGQNFFFEEVGPEPATWTLTFKDEFSEEVLTNILIRTNKATSVDIAEGLPDSHFSNNEGKVVLDQLEPEKMISIYLHHHELGIEKIAEYQFKEGQEHESEHLLKINCNEPAEFAVRIQDSEGIDMRKGWIGTYAVHTAEEFNAALQDESYKGAILIPGQMTTIKGIPSREEVELYFSDVEDVQVSLGKYTIDCGERLEKPLMRISHLQVKLINFYGKMVNVNGDPLEGIRIIAIYSDGKLVEKPDIFFNF